MCYGLSGPRGNGGRNYKSTPADPFTPQLQQSGILLRYATAKKDEKPFVAVGQRSGQLSMAPPSLSLHLLTSLRSALSATDVDSMEDFVDEAAESAQRLDSNDTSNMIIESAMRKPDKIRPLAMEALLRFGARAPCRGTPNLFHYALSDASDVTAKQAALRYVREMELPVSARQDVARRVREVLQGTDELEVSARLDLKQAMKFPQRARIS